MPTRLPVTAIILAAVLAAVMADILPAQIPDGTVAAQPAPTVPTGETPRSSTPASGESAKKRLAILLMQASGRLLGGEPVELRGIEMGLLALEEAVALVPDDPVLCRRYMKLAALAERDDLYEDAVKRLVRLDPGDEVARLRRLDLAIEEVDTAEERVAAYERLLAPDRIGKIGEAVASRLYLDLALLQQRRGDVEAFSEALAEALALDPANRTAAAIAAGFFRMNVTDPYAEAELLVNLLLADPTDVVTQTALANLAIENGAYVAAERLYGMATRNINAVRSRPRGNLVADLAIAQWANGKGGAALRTINVRQQEADELLRIKAWADDPDLDPLERAKITASLGPTLATVRAAVHVRAGDDRAADALDRALRAREEILGELDASQAADAGDVAARIRLEMAWIAVWLGSDTTRARALLDVAAAARPLDENEAKRFEGWLALRDGDPQRAIDLLRTIDRLEPADQLGLGESYLAVGQRRDAARAFLAAARAKPGTLLSIWASITLSELLGRRLPLSDESQRIETLVASIPAVIDYYPDTPSLAVEIDARATKTRFDPFEPIVIDIEIMNNSSFPLAIDREGPIRPQIVLHATATIATGARSPKLPAMVVDIDRHLRLAPRQRIVVPVDLRRLRMGELFTIASVSGMFVRVKAAINAKTTAFGTLVPGLLGGEVWTESIRIDGIRVGSPESRLAWLEQAIPRISAPDREPDLDTMAMLVFVLGPPLPSDAPQELILVYADAVEAFERALPRLEPAAVGWLTGISPVGMVLEPLDEFVRRDGDRLARLMYILYHLKVGDDPLLLAAIDDEDEMIRRIARTTKRRADELERRMDLPGVNEESGSSALPDR